MAWTNEDSAKMDTAAQQAKENLEDLLASGGLDEATVKRIAGWWKDWYRTAGHKRLGRIIVQFGG